MDFELCQNVGQLDARCEFVACYIGNDYVGA